MKNCWFKTLCVISNWSCENTASISHYITVNLFSQTTNKKVKQHRFYIWCHNTRGISSLLHTTLFFALSTMSCDSLDQLTTLTLWFLKYVSWLIMWLFSFNFDDTCPFYRPLRPHFWISIDICSGFQSQGESIDCVLSHFHTMNSSDSPLWWPMLTPWWPAW